MRKIHYILFRCVVSDRPISTDLFAIVDLLLRSTLLAPGFGGLDDTPMLPDGSSCWNMLRVDGYWIGFFRKKRLWHLRMLVHDDIALEQTKIFIPVSVCMT